jgi:hypothetical protein
VRLARTSERLVPSGEDFPGLGGWAVTTSTLLGMLAEVYRSTAPVTVLECGSGSSTLFFALALAQSESGGRVVALESDPGFAEQTRGHLRRLGVDHLALVVDAPLVSQEIPGGDERLWFDLTDLPDIGPVHVLFVDGPVGATSVEARYPAFPCLADRLAGGGLVVLDDTDRPHEKSIQERWTNEEHAGRRLRVERTDVRATYFRVDG